MSFNESPETPIGDLLLRLVGQLDAPDFHVLTSVLPIQSSVHHHVVLRAPAPEFGNVPLRQLPFQLSQPIALLDAWAPGTLPCMCHAIRVAIQKGAAIGTDVAQLVVQNHPGIRCDEAGNLEGIGAGRFGELWLLTRLHPVHVLVEMGEVH